MCAGIAALALLDYGALVGNHGRLVSERWVVGPVADTRSLYQAVKGEVLPEPKE